MNKTEIILRCLRDGAGKVALARFLGHFWVLSNGTARGKTTIVDGQMQPDGPWLHGTVVHALVDAGVLAGNREKGPLRLAGTHHGQQQEQIASEPRVGSKCNDCRWFVGRLSQNGRVLRAQPGVCGWPAPIVEPEGMRIAKWNTPADACACFDQKERRKR